MKEASLQTQITAGCVHTHTLLSNGRESKMLAVKLRLQLTLSMYRNPPPGGVGSGYGPVSVPEKAKAL